MNELLLAAAQQHNDNAHKIVWAGGISAIIGIVVFLYGDKRRGKSELASVYMFAGGSLATVGALVAAYAGK